MISLQLFPLDHGSDYMITMQLLHWNRRGIFCIDIYLISYSDTSILCVYSEHFSAQPDCHSWSTGVNVTPFQEAECFALKPVFIDLGKVRPGRPLYVFYRYYLWNIEPWQCQAKLPRN